jgi:hypothetical protein
VGLQSGERFHCPDQEYTCQYSLVLVKVFGALLYRECYNHLWGHGVLARSGLSENGNGYYVGVVGHDLEIVRVRNELLQLFLGTKTLRISSSTPET